MNIDQAYGDRLEAQMRAADARLELLEAAARERNAQDEMDEISDLRAERDRVRQRLADVRQHSQDDWQAVRREVEGDLTSFRSAVADANDRYSEWDQVREQRFNARLGEAEAALRRQAAQVAEVAADARIQISEAQDDLKARIVAARRSYDAWSQRRADRDAIRALNASELELDEAFDTYAVAVQGVLHRATSQAD